MVIFAEQIFSGVAEQHFTRFVESNEPERFGFLDENHVGNILNNGVEKNLRPLPLPDLLLQ